MYSGINLIGLALCLACVIIIFRYVNGEFSVDRFNKNLDRMYITTVEFEPLPGEIEARGTSYNYSRSAISDLLADPGVERWSSFFIRSDEIELDNQKYTAKMLVTDTNFLKITSYPVINGDIRLSEPNCALVTQQFAQKTFGKQDPVGKTFLNSNGRLLTVKGIIGQPSNKSILSFDVVVSLYVPLITWIRDPQTLVLLYPGADSQHLNSKYNSFVETGYWGSRKVRCQLFPFSKLYFDSHIRKDVSYSSQGNERYVHILLGVGFLILLVGIVNFLNIYTVVFLKRGRELGMKKVFGAEGYKIYIQLLTENLLLIGMALVLSLLFVAIINPFVIKYLQIIQVPDTRFDIALASGILLILPLLTALFPLYRYIYSTPVAALREVGVMKGAVNLRHIFLFFQNLVTLSMIIVSVLFLKQLYLMLNTDPGYRTTDIIKMNFLRRTNENIQSGEKWAEQRRNAEIIQQKMNESTLFTYWTNGRSPNEFIRANTWQFRLDEGELKEVKMIDVNEIWFKLFDIQLKEGRLFNDNTENWRDFNVIVTASALKFFGIKDFRQALLYPDRRISMWGGQDPDANPPYRIVGVVNDIHFLHLTQKSAPIIFMYGGDFNAPLIASIANGRRQDAIAFLKQLNEETARIDLNYSFVEDEVRAMYKEDEKLAFVCALFALIAIAIASIGLFSMSLFESR